jgi:hypothetical protein
VAEGADIAQPVSDGRASSGVPRFAANRVLGGGGATFLYGAASPDTSDRGPLGSLATALADPAFAALVTVEPTESVLADARAVPPAQEERSQALAERCTRSASGATPAETNPALDCAPAPGELWCTLAT